MPLGPESGVLSNLTITESQNREGDWGATKMAIRESRKLGIYKNGKLRVYKNGDWGSERRINKMTVFEKPGNPQNRESQKQGGEGGEAGGIGGKGQKGGVRNI